MSQKGSVEVVELVTRDGGRVLMMGRGLEGQGLDLSKHEYPLSYIWNRMRQEEGRFFLVQWEESDERPSYYQIPRGIEIGGRNIDMSHHNIVYNEGRAAIGTFEDLSRDHARNQIFIRMFPSR